MNHSDDANGDLADGLHPKGYLAHRLALFVQNRSNLNIPVIFSSIYFGKSVISVKCSCPMWFLFYVMFEVSLKESG